MVLIGIIILQINKIKKEDEMNGINWYYNTTDK